MNTRVLSLTLILLIINPDTFVANASELKIYIETSPTPHHKQVMAYGSYVFNVTLENKGLTVLPGEPVDEAGTLRHTGRIIISMILTLRGRGSYDFGEATTGYVTPVLDEVEFGETIMLPSNSSRAYISFNHTFTEDAYEYGLKPYEDVEIAIKVKAYHEIYTSTTGPAKTSEGPEVGEYTMVYNLIDELMIGYVEGKLIDMAEEIKPIRGINKPEYINTALFLDMLDDMNSSILEGNYVEALKIYKRYDEKYRLSFISSLTKEAQLSRERADIVTDLEWRITQLESTLVEQENRLQLELDQALARYATLSQTYLKEQAELEAAKQSLTTAITAVFLASIAFFFIGRRTATGKLFELGERHQGLNGDDAAPSVRGDTP